VIDRVAQAAEDAAKEADRSLSSLKGTITEEVSGIKSTAETAAEEVTGLIDRLPNNIPALINEEVQNVREGLLPEAVNATSLNQAIESQVKAVLPVTLDQLQKAVNRVEELGRSEALQSFLENPAGYVLDAVFSEARRRVGEGLGSRIRRLTNALLVAATSDETRQRLRDQAEEADT
jgi:glutamyl-tRNA reductase